MKPPPPMPDSHGSTTLNVSAVVTAASTALPPRASTAAPASAASEFWQATSPLSVRRSSLRTFQCSPMGLSKPARADGLRHGAFDAEAAAVRRILVMIGDLG